MKYFKFFSYLLIILLMFGCASSNNSIHSASYGNKRVALVIGNANYEFGKLKNPINDAKDLSQKLLSMNFDVVYRVDVSSNNMQEAIDRFINKIDKNTISLFYYAGHAVQINNINYLIPVNENIYDENSLVEKSISLNYIFSKLQDANARENIIILDACRNNPFEDKNNHYSTKLASRGLPPINRGLKKIHKGLASVKAPDSTYVAYSTEPGSVARDGRGRNGTYTKYLLKYIDKPGISIERMFKKVRASVKIATDNQQIPWEHTSLVDDFYFVSAPKRRLFGAF